MGRPSTSNFGETVPPGPPKSPPMITCNQQTVLPRLCKQRSFIQYTFLCSEPTLLSLLRDSKNVIS